MFALVPLATEIPSKREGKSDLLCTSTCAPFSVDNDNGLKGSYRNNSNVNPFIDPAFDDFLIGAFDPLRYLPFFCKKNKST